jgi:hypothetical protein
MSDPMWHHGAEIAGLGILAAPHIKNAITGKSVSKKTERNSELAGLGVLAAPSIHTLGKHLMKRGSVEPAVLVAMSDEMQKIAFTLAELAAAGGVAGGAVGAGVGAVKAEKGKRLKGAAKGGAIGAGLGATVPGAAILGGTKAGRQSVKDTFKKKTKTAGGFDRAVRMAREAKGVVGKHPGKVTGSPASFIRGKPMTGTPMGGGINRATLPKKPAMPAPSGVLRKVSGG